MYTHILHFLGDALSNVGIICTGLILLLAPPSWNSCEVYFDPVISLVIVCIILGSTVPLVCSASFVLLQSVPATISLERVRAVILAIEGVQNLYELHIWQLSESKNIASVHVLATRELDFRSAAPSTTRACTRAPYSPSTMAPPHTLSTPPAPPSHSLLPMLIIMPMTLVGSVGGVIGGQSRANSVWRHSGGVVVMAMSEDTPCLVLCPPEEGDPRDNPRDRRTFEALLLPSFLFRTQDEQEDGMTIVKWYLLEGGVLTTAAHG
ncbi:cation efflux family-domain-containing protein [Mycena metata]|uniref:Cation efflux family-domain-containing protein n=1 Tax=Mycena metata TaxID=1033252 RepID=A0AAD7GJ32_9AGAR|nr:cation efflux family-domain-containing protein [Mycena metata]